MRDLTTAFLMAAAWLVSSSGPIAAQTVILAGEDAWTTPEPHYQNPTQRTSYDFAATPIPADFFGPGSQPFSGKVNFVGNPLLDDPCGNPNALGLADTIVRRLADTAPLSPGGQDTVPIEIVALSLRSVDPIPVSFGTSTQQWNVKVSLSPNVMPQPPGSMTIRMDLSGNGGTFDAAIPVVVRFIFTRGAQTLNLDCGLGQCPQMNLQASGHSWTLPFGPSGYDPLAHGILRIMPGQAFDGDCDGFCEGSSFGSSNFVAGVDPVTEKCEYNSEAETALAGSTGNHGVISTANDSDMDGWPDECDNCPLIPNGDQNPAACLSTGIPTMGEYALMTLVVLLLAAGVLLLRKREAAFGRG